ncbi:conserved hypothetical protein [Rippkaea orientalis PCC 8801]|uniref:50S ribosomal protein L7/L12 n=1 Tax=Rippkaea orientalis (strain PCC 8801 / RF-1) TaxID=41431 RepID=B7JXV6_RIPO1|nr:hypothetical protein [Rippkaea orientalis]ACK65920.1 conserved hypothetical protein [Rippkaea orientalis PCC 8801]
MNITKAEIKDMIMQLPIKEIKELINEIEENLEIKDFMQLAETGFQEWDDPEEDIYNNDP